MKKFLSTAVIAVSIFVLPMIGFANHSGAISTFEKLATVSKGICGLPGKDNPGFCSCFDREVVTDCKLSHPASFCQSADMIRNYMLMLYGHNPANICIHNPMPGVSQAECITDITYFLAPHC